MSEYRCAEPSGKFLIRNQHGLFLSYGQPDWRPAGHLEICRYASRKEATTSLNKAINGKASWTREMQMTVVEMEMPQESAPRISEAEDRYALKASTDPTMPDGPVVWVRCPRKTGSFGIDWGEEGVWADRKADRGVFDRKTAIAIRVLIKGGWSRRGDARLVRLKKLPNLRPHLAMIDQAVTRYTFGPWHVIRTPGGWVVSLDPEGREHGLVAMAREKALAIAISWAGAHPSQNPT
jgi:hypothetical protein